MSEFVVQFLTRKGCHLCDEIRPRVEGEVRRVGGSLQEVDVDGDDRLLTDFGSRIPVVLDDQGNVIAEGRIDPRLLRRRLRELR